MNLRGFFSAFLITLIVIASNTNAASIMFDKKEITLYENELYNFNSVNANAEVTVDDNVNYIKKNKSFSIFKNKVNVKETRNVYLGGQTVGIAFYTEGIFVTDTVPVEDASSKYQMPANDAGIRKGDYLIEANGIKLNDVSNLDAIIKASSGNKINLVVKRNNELFETQIQPVKSIKDNEYRVGLWMRDSAAGLGTITYIDTNNNFMALGHAICDSDTGGILSVRDGRIVECDITGVKKGSNGSAGELKGTFGINAKQLGEIQQNTKFGIKGTIYNNESKQLISVGSRDLIRDGDAVIYSDFENGKIKKYSIEILHINEQTYPSEKGMVIKITDKELINKTGGIVQGLSGSPIVQDGKLIGAVTHVMINDPTKGYGIFIENMLDNLQNVSEQQIKIAS